jgi:hypothetical protein
VQIIIANNTTILTRTVLNGLTWNTQLPEKMKLKQTTSANEI